MSTILITLSIALEDANAAAIPASSVPPPDQFAALWIREPWDPAISRTEAEASERRDGDGLEQPDPTTSKIICEVRSDIPQENKREAKVPGTSNHSWKAHDCVQSPRSLCLN